MRIVSDRNIPFVEDAFASLGDVVTLPAGQIDAAAVRDADMLLCRTTIKVGPQLLDGSKVRFVATATIGTDHLDIPWLEGKGIRWASAPGSNADSVQLWFACALATYCLSRGIDPSVLRIGIVGVGHVGSRVARLASAFGGKPLLCDPPRARVEGRAQFVELDELVAACDLVTLHVPLSNDGVDRTRALFDGKLLSRMRRGALLVNACRGEVVDGGALLRSIEDGKLQAMCDVFPDEPTPSAALVRACLLSTPHVAGHSLDGKVNGTDMIYRAACSFLGVEPAFSARARLEAPQPSQLLVSAYQRTDAHVLDAATRPFYDIAADDRALREIVERGDGFRAYRDAYAVRREPRGVHVRMDPRRARIASVLTELGMVVT